MEGRFWKGLLSHCDDPVIREDSMRDYFHIALRHVTRCAIVGRILVLANGKSDGAAFLRVTSQALLAVIRWCLLLGWLHMGIVAGNAAQSAAAVPVALAEGHGKIMLKEIRLGNRGPLKGHHKNGQRFVELPDRRMLTSPVW